MRTIGEVAELAGMTVGSLRYYDRIGLLKPLARSDSGYRFYGRDELLRLREILIWRRLGFSLADIAALIDEPGHDRLQALERQLELAGAQLDKFQGLARGLKAAVAAIGAGGSIAEDDVFDGFARLADEEEDELPGPPAPVKAGSRRIATFSLLSGRSHLGTADGFGDGIPQRIVATDPIRLAESLIALGIVPVGAGTYEGRFTGQRDPGEWTWPPLVEQVVRGQIRDVGFYGSDASRIEALAPDMIIDLTSHDESASCLAQSASWGRYGHEDLERIAPTALVPYYPPDALLPGFRHFLLGVATAVDRRELAVSLLAVWDARVRTLAAHLARQGEVAVVATWGPGSIWGDACYAPTDEHYCQVFSALGLPVAVPEGAERTWPDAVTFELDQLHGLDARTVFVHTRHLDRGKVNALLHGPALARLPAMRLGRVFELSWEFVNSGWFGAHWQLAVIAHAFGLVQLRAGDGEDAVLAVAEPAAAALELTSAHRDVSAVLCGPGLAPTRVELHAQCTTRVEVTHEAARSLCGLPELYSLHVTDRSTPVRFAHDRESALARLAADRAPPVPAPRSAAGFRRPAGESFHVART